MAEKIMNPSIFNKINMMLAIFVFWCLTLLLSGKQLGGFASNAGRYSCIGHRGFLEGAKISFQFIQEFIGFRSHSHLEKAEAPIVCN